MTNGAVVFAGGGLAGIAWETGVLRGIQEAEPHLYEALVDASTTFVGTSAGSAVAAQVAGGTPLADLYAAQLSSDSAEIGADVDLDEFMTMMGAAVAGATSPEEVRRRIGVIALGVDGSRAPARLAAVDARLPVKEWSARRLLLTAINTATGELRVFDRDSGVALATAVAASCAVPGIWPSVEIQGELYMDGGMRTVANADLAAGADRVLILVPSLAQTPMGSAISQAELDALAPAKVHTIYADATSIEAFGANPLDPATRPPSARAGFEVGKLVASEVAQFWG